MCSYTHLIQPIKFITDNSTPSHNATLPIYEVQVQVKPSVPIILPLKNTLGI